MRKTREVSLVIFLLGLGQSCLAASLADFTKCTSAQGQGSVCQLDAATYEISSTLFIGRSNITIKGSTVGSPDATVLQRAPGFTNAILRDPYPGALTSITIRDLTFDGNREQQSAAFSAFTPELDIYSSKSILITNARFVNSPNIGLGIFGGGASGIVINNSTFMNSVSDNLWTGPLGYNPDQVPNGYKICSTLAFPDNVILANSTIRDAGENGIYLDATNVQIINNTFQRNQSNTIPFNDSGGQVDLSVCSDNVAAVGNTVIDGPLGLNGKWADGFEVHATNVSLIDNVVQNNAGNGIVMFGPQHSFVANWNSATGVMKNNTSSLNKFAGILIYNLVGWRTTDSITIDHANVINGQTYGVQFANQTGVPFNHIAVTNNCFKGNLNGAVQLDDMGPDVVIANNVAAGCGPN